MPTPHSRNAPSESTWRTIQPKFCPKKPTVKVSGRNTVATSVRRSVTRLRRLSPLDGEIFRGPHTGARGGPGRPPGGGGGGGGARGGGGGAAPPQPGRGAGGAPA